MAIVTDSSTDYEGVDISAIDAEIRRERDQRPRASHRTVGLVLLIGSLLAWIASFALAEDKMALLENPNANLSCDINPLISCGTFIQTWQAETFGFPNMYLGLGGFAIMGAVGTLYLSKAELPRWFQWATFGGLVSAFAFVLWLASNALFAIHALCPWCLVVWAATAPMLFSYCAHLVESGMIEVHGAMRAILRSWIWLSIAWYALVVVLAFIVFFPQWMAMLGL